MALKPASVVQIKKELQHKSDQELIAYCLRLSKFKKENKELLSYLLFQAEDEEGYIMAIQEDIDQKLEAINTSNYYYIKKSVRRILRDTRKYIRYSGNKETEVELLLHFSYKLSEYSPSIFKNKVLENIYLRLLQTLETKITGLHEDLQYDYNLELEQLTQTWKHANHIS